MKIWAISQLSYTKNIFFTNKIFKKLTNKVKCTKGSQ